MNEDNVLIFTAWDVNDPNWDRVIKVLRDNIPDFEVRYGDGNNMIFVFPSKENAPV